MRKEKVAKPRGGVSFGITDWRDEPMLTTIKGRYILELVDTKSGTVLETRELDNLITLDAGVLSAILYGCGANPSPAQSGLTMLAVGTGATGPTLGPDAPDPRQRHLNAELTLGRKAFSARQYRTAAGAVAGVPTNILDLTCSFGEGEAVGPWNEMGLLRTISQNPLVKNPVPSVFPTYDPTIDLTLYDIMVNYTTFSVMTKRATMTMNVIWRLTF